MKKMKTMKKGFEVEREFVKVFKCVGGKDDLYGENGTVFKSNDGDGSAP